MIKKLKQRIFVLIMLSLSIIMLGTILLFAILNYNNTIDTTNFMMDRFIGEEHIKNPEGRGEDYRIKPEITIDGVYNLLVQNSKIIQSSSTTNDEKINEYALKIAKKNAEKGIIGKYVYKVRRLNPDTLRITLMENENAITHIKTIFLVSIIISVISVIAIYELAKNYLRLL